MTQAEREQRIDAFLTGLVLTSMNPDAEPDTGMAACPVCREHSMERLEFHATIAEHDEATTFRACIPCALEMEYPWEQA